MEYVNLEHKAFVKKLNQIVLDTIGDNRYSGDYEGNVYWHAYEQLQNNEEPWPALKLKRDLINRLAPNYNEVLEIGINAGHSASIWLFTNPNIKVKAIDIEFHKYTKPCAELLKETFPDRFEYFPGDSRKVFPEQNEHFVNCDMVHIDGGHDRHIFTSDFDNAMALPHGNFARAMLIDDAEYPGINPIWKDAVDAGKCSILQVPDFTYYEYHTVLVKNA
jgi:hypothetical protein